MTTGGPYAAGSAGHPQTRDRNRAVGDTVRALRKKAGLSQEQLAELAGCDRQSVNRVENAAYSPSLHRVFLLADALRVPVGRLVAAADELRPAQTAAAGGPAGVLPRRVPGGSVSR